MIGLLMLMPMVGASFAKDDVLTVRRACHVPASWITVEPRSGMRPRLHLQPSRHADYVKVDCMLREVKKIAQTRGEWPDMGFVGNEAPPGEKPR